MAARFTMRTYGVNQLFRFDEGIWLHRKSRQPRFFFGKDLFYTILHNSELPSCISTMPHDKQHQGKAKLKLRVFRMRKISCLEFPPPSTQKNHAYTPEGR